MIVGTLPVTNAALEEGPERMLDYIWRATWPNAWELGLNMGMTMYPVMERCGRAEDKPRDYWLCWAAWRATPEGIGL